MTTYVLYYDRSGDDSSLESSLIDDICEKIEGHRINRLMWLIETTMSPARIVDFVQSSLDGDSSIWVFELTSVRSYNQALPGTGDWLARHRPER